MAPRASCRLDGKRERIVVEMRKRTSSLVGGVVELVDGRLAGSCGIRGAGLDLAAFLRTGHCIAQAPWELEEQ